MAITIKNCYVQNSGGVHTNGVALRFTCAACNHQWIVENGSAEKCEACGSPRFDVETVPKKEGV